MDHDTHNRQSLETNNENTRNDGSARTDPSWTHTSFKTLTTIGRPIAPYREQHSGKENARPSAKGCQNVVRLGKKELGPFAWEEQMPKVLIRRLKRGEPVRYFDRTGSDGGFVRDRVVQNEVSGLIPILARLCAACGSLETAYVCHPSVQHIFKGLKNQGHFCGYRNIQMLLSFIQGSQADGHDRLGARLPNIIDLQKLIEKEWDNNPCSSQRTQTGGILNTRKWIGTLEVEALFRSLNLTHSVQIFAQTRNSQARYQLLDFVENYFSCGSPQERPKVQKTHRPPLYLQQEGHSLTIVGFERFKDGTRGLLVFDPGLGPSEPMRRLLGMPSSRITTKVNVDALLWPYRRGENRLQNLDPFQTIALAAPNTEPV